MQPHHPGRLGALQDMPPPCGQGHTGGLVASGNPTATQRLADAQPRTPGRQPYLQGPLDQGGHHEKGGDTSAATSPHPTRRRPNEGGGTLPTTGSPQGSGPSGTPQTPPRRPHRQGTHAASHPLPCRTCSRCALTYPTPHRCRRSPSTGLQDAISAPQKNAGNSTPAPQAPVTPRDHPPLSHDTTQHMPDLDSPRRQTPRNQSSPPLRRLPSEIPTSSKRPPRQGPGHAPWLVLPTRQLDQAHLQGPPVPGQPRERSSWTSPS